MNTSVAKDVQSWGVTRPAGFLIASGPEFDTTQTPSLAYCGATVDAFEMMSVDARKSFHLQLMSEEEMDQLRKGWRPDWKGKATTCINLMLKHGPKKPVAVEGEPECQREVD